MTSLVFLLKKTLAALLVPLAFFAGAAVSVDLMSCRAQGIVAQGCCCPPTALSVAVDEHPRLEQGCCVGFSLAVASEAPGPQTVLSFAPLAKPLVAALPSASVLFEHPPAEGHRRAQPDLGATGPPLRVLHCSYLT